jgi:hypothetical protein
MTTSRPWSLSQLHLLLTGECKYECDHCFVWSSPETGNTMTRDTVAHILAEAQALGTIEWFYFEGGEPFLCYELLLWGVQRANQLGFKTGIVSNAYWAEDESEALEQLYPFAGLVQDLSISDDAYHGSDESDNVATARKVAGELDIPVGFISVSGPDGDASCAAPPALTAEDTSVRYRGRAAEILAPLVMHQPWDGFTKCPWEELRQPERVHVDSLGNLHVCQGLVIGNLLDKPLPDIMRGYDPDTHPVVGPLLRGGPAELVRAHSLDHEPAYADACHLCYTARSMLRERFPDELAPDQMYGDTS